MSRKGVAIDDHEGRGPQQRQRVEYPAAGFERRAALLAVLEPHAELPPIAQAARICAPSQDRLMITSRMPARARASRCQAMSGLPPATSRGLGV